jgi:hypothetical protein
VSDLNAIRLLNFSGRKEEWMNWSEKFVAKAKRSGIKGVLLGKSYRSQRLQKSLRRNQKKEEE